MTAAIAWGGAALGASTALMLLVLALRAPVRRWAGPRLGYALWALPALRLFLPMLPLTMLDGLPLAGTAASMSVLFIGPHSGAGLIDDARFPSLDAALVVVWLVGAIGLFALYAVRHLVFCRRLRATGTGFGRAGGVNIIAADVDGPLAFGVRRRFIAVPRSFTRDYSLRERDLVLAHEAAHHARGDLVANWLSLVVLAAHWRNPVAWIAIRAFRDDQEFAADAHVLAAGEPDARVVYGRVIAKAAGIGALPVCHLNARSNLKGRLMMLSQTPRSGRRLVFGAAALTFIGSAALAVTATPDMSGSAGKQAVTIGVKPDGAGGYTLIVDGSTVAPGAPLPTGVTLPGDFTGAGGCDLTPAAKPNAMVIRGSGATRTYTVMCASAAPAPVGVTLAESLASLKTMRASVATQPATAVFPEAERAHALGAIDRSIGEVEATLAPTG